VRNHSVYAPVAYAAGIHPSFCRSLIIAAELRAMRSWIDYADKTVKDPQPTLVEELVQARTPCWLDIEDPTDEVIDGLATRLRLHPLAVEDSKQFGQRASLWIYEDVAMIVAFGLDQELRELVEVHCYCTPGFLITLHRGLAPGLSDLRRTDGLHPVLGAHPIQVLHRVISALHAPFPEWVLRLNEQLDRLEQRVLRQPTDHELAEVIAVRHRAAEMRHRLEPGRDLAARLPLILSLPGATEQSGL
jgi:magnesium transporter